MVTSRCSKESFVPIEAVGTKAYRIRFSAYPDGEDFLIYTSEIICGELTPEKVRDVRLKELVQFDNSSDVNSFFVNEKPMWFDKLTRTSIAHSIQVEKDSGKEFTELYDNDGVKYTLPIDEAISLFDQVELYAKACYNQTALHKVELNSLETVDELLAYDIKGGYPEKLHFNIGLI